MFMLTRILFSVRLPPSGVISRVHIAQECSWYSTMIIPPSYLMFPSSPGVGLISPLTFKSKQISMYVQGISNNKAQVKKGKIGLTCLRIYVPNEVAISVLVIFGYQSINWFWTFNLWTLNFYLWEEKKWVKTLMRSRSEGWFRIGNMLSTLNNFSIPKEPIA